MHGWSLVILYNNIFTLSVYYTGKLINHNSKKLKVYSFHQRKVIFIPIYTFISTRIYDFIGKYIHYNYSETRIVAWMSSAGKDIWIGGTKVGGVWKWKGSVDSAIVVADWRADEPNHSSQFCVQMFSQGKDFQWDNDFCHGRKYFMCEK